MTVYLDVMTWFVAYWFSFFTRPFLSKQSSGSGWLTNTDRGGPAGRLREKKDSTLKAASLSYQRTIRDLRFADIASAVVDDERDGRKRMGVGGRR
jgi:hypothetical protein